MCGEFADERGTQHPLLRPTDTRPLLEPQPKRRWAIMGIITFLAPIAATAPWTMANDGGGARECGGRLRAFFGYL